MSKKNRVLFHPFYWPVWLAVAVLWLLAKLPYAWLLKIGKGIGRLMLRFNHKARRTAEINLKLCFPEQTALQRKQLLRDNFYCAGISVVETALAWWGKDKQLQPLLHIQGMEHLDAALLQGKGVIFCSAHFMTLELAGRLFAKQRPFAVIYRPQKNPVLDSCAKHYRQQIYQQIIARGDLRTLIRCLKNNGVVWFTPDVDAGEKNSIFADFFGIPAATITATTRLASLSGAQLIPIFSFRRADSSGYDIQIFPALTNYPSANLPQDTQRLNQIIEAAVRRYPEQYLWQYKRFKTRPPGEKRFYD